MSEQKTPAQLQAEILRDLARKIESGEVEACAYVFLTAPVRKWDDPVNRGAYITKKDVMMQKHLLCGALVQVMSDIVHWSPQPAVAAEPEKPLPTPTVAGGGMLQ
jgi:hypothetical protein